MDTFQTKTNVKLYVRKLLCIMVICFIPIIVILAVMLYGNTESIMDYFGSLMLVCGTLMLISVPVCIIMAEIYKCYTLYFQGDRINIVGKLKNQNYVIYDITAADLIIEQTKRQKKNDTCTFKVVNTIFNLPYVENCEALKDYIKAHFSSAETDE